VFPLDYIADVVAPRSEEPKLIICVITFAKVQPICSRYINVTDGGTDRQTDRRLTIATPRFALCASRGKQEAHLPLRTRTSAINFFVAKAVRKSGIQLQYNCNTRTFSCIAAVLSFCGLLQYNKIFVLFYCSCIVVVFHLCGPLKSPSIAVMNWTELSFMTYSYVYHLWNLLRANLLRTQRINSSMRPQQVLDARPHCRLMSPF